MWYHKCIWINAMTNFEILFEIDIEGIHWFSLHVINYKHDSRISIAITLQFLAFHVVTTGWFGEIVKFSMIEIKLLCIPMLSIILYIYISHICTLFGISVTANHRMMKFTACGQSISYHNTINMMNCIAKPITAQRRHWFSMDSMSVA